MLRLSKRIVAFSAVVIVILAALPTFAVENTWKGVERIVAVGDVHGDFD